MFTALGDIAFYGFRRIIQNLGMAQKPQKIFNHTGIIEAIADPLIQIEFQVHIFAFDDFAVPDFFRPALPAKGAEGRNRAEVIQVMVYRLDAQ